MMGDAVAVLLGGRLEQAGSADDVFRRPRTVHLAQFLGCENLIEAEARSDVRPGCVNVHLGDSVVSAAAASPGRVGVCVRPEAVGPDAMAVVGSGTIVETSDRGALVRLVVEVDGQRWVSLVSHSERRTHRLDCGAAVVLSIAPDALHIIPLEVPR